MFTVASCTGYSTPGLDLVLARDLGMDPGVQRLLVGHMGCYAAMPALGAVADFVVARRRPAVLLCVELTSLHIQPATDDVSQMVAHALFSDAAAAVVLRPDESSAGDGCGLSGLHFVDMVAVADHSTADHMTWDITDLGFRMGLSPHVPNVLARHVGGVIRDRLLAPHGLTPADVTGWAVHPGGRRILEVVEEQLELPADAMRPVVRGARRERQLLVGDRADGSRAAAGRARPGRRDGLRSRADAVRRAADPPLTPDPSDRGSTTAEHVETVARGRFSHHFCVLEDSDALAPCRVRGPVPRAHSR